MRNKLLSILLVCITVNAYAQVTNSVLATGTWYKVAVVNDGIYKLTYSDLQSLGINVSSIDPRNIAMYGNGGGMLPTANDSATADDLTELAIKVIGENDGKFDVGDYVLFYGQSQHRWHLDADNRFHHTLNVYSDTTYYFLTVGANVGKRISSVASSTLTANSTVTSFDDYAFHELDSVNLIKSGRTWYGEEFDQFNTTRDFRFAFPNHVDSFYINSVPIARSVNYACSFNVYVNSLLVLSEAMPAAPPCYFCTFALPSSSNTSVTFIARDTIDVNLEFIPSPFYTAAIAWLDYLEVNVRRQLSIFSPQLFFRDKNSVSPGAVSDFTIANTTASDFTWDITDQGNVLQVQTAFSSGNTTMRLLTDSLRNFVTFDSTSALPTILIGEVANQNLHGMPQAQMIMITPPDFLAAANNLAARHIAFDGMTVNVATTDQVYNEFSSGSQDISAIRNFIRMFYNRAMTLGTPPQYVILFGDASYDYKNRIPGNTNFVPTYQSINSLDPTSSYLDDDFFTFLDGIEDLDNPNSTCLMDLAVGRLPAKSLSEANTLVDKIIHYQSSSDFADWRKRMAFVDDAGDEDIHVLQTEYTANYFDSLYCDFDQTKIYLDAYKEVGDTAFPDANIALNNAVDTAGCLAIIYTGHGGPAGWSAYRLLTKPMITSWNNINRMTFFVTETCDFNHFDDPSDTSGGELAVLSPTGAAIACWGSTRIAFSQANFDLMKAFDPHLLQQIDSTGKYRRIGEIIELSKNGYPSVSVRNATLLGDPAIRLNYPVNNVVLTDINGALGSVDTLGLGDAVSGNGLIQDYFGTTLSSFSGNLQIMLLGQQTDSTLANDSITSYKYGFHVWGDTIYKGNVTVTNGAFSFSFNVPINTSLYYRKSKFSFYATNGTTDATGCYTSLVVGNMVQGIHELQNTSAGISIYPNPATSVTTIELNTLQSSPFSFYMTDMEGRRVTNMENISTKIFSVNVSDLAKGMYIFTIDNKNHEVVHGKIVVQ